MPFNLSDLLAHYTPFDDGEATMTAQLQDFLAELEDHHEERTAFGRELAGHVPHWGHVTGSAWVINRDGTRVVMVHHAKLGRWVQPGGHCDDNPDVLSVARRETLEETGLNALPLQNGIFDVDAHLIPEYWNTPEHLHYDVRFLLQADDATAPVLSPESRAVRWVTLDEAAVLNSSPSITRMIAKTRQLFTPATP